MNYLLTYYTILIIEKSISGNGVIFTYKTRNDIDLLVFHMNIEDYLINKIFRLHKS